MGAKETQPFFDQVQYIRAVLSKRLVDFMGQSQNQRENYVAEYIAEHEDQNEKNLRVLLDKPLRVGSNWVRYFPLDKEHDIVRLLEDDSKWQEFSSTIDTTLKIKSKLIDLFEVCALNYNRDEVKEYFERCAETENEQIKNISRRLVELDQGY